MNYRYSSTLRKTFLYLLQEMGPLFTLLNRHKPSFFILGPTKCGTTSLFQYLLRHPSVAPPFLKEPNQFSKSFPRFHITYLRYVLRFPRKGQENIRYKWATFRPDGSVEDINRSKNMVNVEGVITGEASADYLTEAPPHRLARYFPGARLIIMRRHPVDRSISHYRMIERYHHTGRKGYEKLQPMASFFKEEINRYRKDLNTRIIHRSFYRFYKEQWLKWFSTGQVMTISLDDLAKDPGTTVQSVYKFLGLRDYSPPIIPPENVPPQEHSDDDNDSRAMLDYFYREHNMLVGDEPFWSGLSRS